MSSNQVRGSRFTVIGLLTIVIFFMGAYVQYGPPVMATQITTNKVQLPFSNISCQKVHLSDALLPLTALASFPGSGNTWLRHLIQEMTGIATGAVYLDKDLLKNGFPGEGEMTGKTIAIKTHRMDYQKYSRCVLLVRNPYEAFLAEFNRFNTQRHDGIAHVDQFCKGWNDHVQKSYKRYTWFHTVWAKHENLHLVLYDTLKENLEAELTKVLGFLQNSTNITGDVQCALQNNEGNFKRNHSQTMPFGFFYSIPARREINRVINVLHTIYKDRFPAEAKKMKTWKV